MVFLGYEPGRRSARRLPRRAGRRRTSRSCGPASRTASTEKLGITYTYDYKVSTPTRRTRTSSSAAEQAGQAGAADRVPDGVQRPGEERPGRHDEPRHRRAQRGEVAGATTRRAGVDTRRNTVFFVNWYGRSDFKFHVYTKTDEPDPDTGYDFGVQRDSRKMIAWGGTTADDEENGLGSHPPGLVPRPVRRPGVVDRQLERRQRRTSTANGVEDYRMPPIWEYAAGGYRAPAALAGDLAKITRYVALNLLFTTSPLYPVELPTAEPPQVDQHRQQHLRGLARRQRVGAVHQAGPARRRAARAALAQHARLRQPGPAVHRRGRARATSSCSRTCSCYPGPAATRRSPTCSCRTRSQLAAHQGRPGHGRLRAADLQLRRRRGRRLPRARASPTTTTATAPSRTSSRSSPRRSSRPGTG